MTGTPDVTSGCENGQAVLPVNPWRALLPRFGMLLGVQDFETIGAYHRGKSQLHNAWLHGEGVVWGFEVQLPPDDDSTDSSSDATHEFDSDKAEAFDPNEVRVRPGLAQDALGRALHLERDACLNVPAWYDKHSKAIASIQSTKETEDGHIAFEACVVARFHGCLTRPVPALAEPCEGSQNVTSHSRVFETVELKMIPGPPPPRPRPPYHRLRLLFGLTSDVTAADSDNEVAGFSEALQQRQKILKLPPDKQSAEFLAAFHRFAALDEMDLEPARDPQTGEPGLFPQVEPAQVVLAHLKLTLGKDSGTLIDGAADNTVRRVLIPTSTIQELCGPLFPLAGSDSDELTGPVVVHDSVKLDGPKLRFTIDRAGSETTSGTFEYSVSDQSVIVSTFSQTSGWSTVTPASAVTFDQASGQGTFDLGATPTSGLVRLIVLGTGLSPVLGTNNSPLGARASNPHMGQDFVTIIDPTPSP